MKKITLKSIALAVVLSVVSCNKEQDTVEQNQSQYQVSLAEARIIAENTLQESKTEDTKVDIRTINDQQGNVAIYIANDLKDGGFTIISGDKRTEEVVLGYGDDAISTADMPDNMKFWLNNVTSHISEVRADKKADFEAIQKFNSRIATIEPAYKKANQKDITAPFSLKTTWNQGCVYNSFSPAANSTPKLSKCEKALPCEKAYTGCVATGLAQVVNYYKSMNGYNYNLMKENYTTTDLNTPNGNEVGKLMKKIGDIMLMDYTCTGSGSFAGMLLKRTTIANSLGFKNTFKNNTLNNIKYTLNLELKNKQIVAIEGFDNANNAGHLYLLDGTYTDPTTKTIYNHINWGWGGKNNGWFVYNDFAVGKYNFKDNVSAFYGFVK